MRNLGKLILLIALVWFTLSLYFIFWPSTNATVYERSNISLSQNGYNGVNKSNIQNFNGTTVSFHIAAYRYTVNGKTYEGKGLTDSEDYNPLKIYYCPIYPAFSVTKNTIPLLWILLLGIIGFGILEIDKWLKNLPRKGIH